MLNCNNDFNRHMIFLLSLLVLVVVGQEKLIYLYKKKPFDIRYETESYCSTKILNQHILPFNLISLNMHKFERRDLAKKKNQSVTCLYRQKSYHMCTYSIWILMIKNESELENDLTILNILFLEYNLQLMTGLL